MRSVFLRKSKDFSGEKKEDIPQRDFLSVPHQSLRLRLIRGNLFILGFVLLCIGCTTYTLISYSFVAHVDMLLQNEGKRLEVATHVWFSERRPLGNTFFNALANQDKTDEFYSYLLYVKLFDPHTGKVLMRSASLARTRLPFDHQDFQAALHGQSV